MGKPPLPQGDAWSPALSLFQTSCSSTKSQHGWVERDLNASQPQPLPWVGCLPADQAAQGPFSLASFGELAVIFHA